MFKLLCKKIEQKLCAAIGHGQLVETRRGKLGTSIFRCETCGSRLIGDTTAKQRFLTPCTKEWDKIIEEKKWVYLAHSRAIPACREIDSIEEEAYQKECTYCGGTGGYVEKDPCAGPQWYDCSYCNGTGVDRGED